MASPSLPGWLRLLLFADRLVDRAARAESLLRDEVLLMMLTPEQQDLVTQRHYDRDNSYHEGGVFERSLFPWEEAALSSAEVPTAGRVLLGGAGGGRELRGLVERGFEVVAFEPSAHLFARASAVASTLRGARVLRGSYRDLVAAVEGQGGPLSTIGEQGPYDLVVLGWGSLAHVLSPREQEALLRAARALAPASPLLMSYFARRDEKVSGPEPRIDAIRRRLRRALKIVGGHDPPPWVYYNSAAGLLYSFGPGEAQALAGRAGYRLVFEREDPHHALLRPA